MPPGAPSGDPGPVPQVPAALSAPPAAVLAVEAIDPVHRLVIGVIVDAVEEGHDPLGIDGQGRRLLPEPIAAAAIAEPELGLDQAAGQLKDHLPLPEFIEAPLESGEVGPVGVHRRRGRHHAPPSWRENLLTQC